MCVHDMEGNLLFVNPAAASALGFRAKDGVGWNLRRYLVPSVQGQFDAYLDRIRSTGVDSGLMRLVGKDGVEQVWLYRNTRYDEPGHPPVVLGHAQDVTGLIRAQGEIRESNRRFQILADAAPVMIWMSDSSGRCIFVNSAWLRFRGRTAEHEQHDRWLEGVHPDDRTRCLDARRAAVSTHQPFRLEYRLQRADGEYRWVLDHGVSKNRGPGRVRGVHRILRRHHRAPASAGRLGARSRGTGPSRGGAHRGACSRQRGAPGSDRPPRRTSRGVSARPTTRVAGTLGERCGSRVQ